ncbi:MAG: alanine racemase C-terminal domain-containing protein, partial [Armatimonadota bacterium]|nr:alanine racemase C-terminal domain-containing protein [Armatimonadota bacterium]
LEASHLDMVRPGTILYGQYPGPHVPRCLDLRETWRLKTRVSFVKRIGRGDTVGYGPDFVAPRAMTVATLPIGYCDGLTLTPVRTARGPRELAAVLRDFARRGRMGVTLHGQHAPFVGRVSMQMCCVDVTHIPNVQVGDEALIPTRRTLTNPRLPRVYVGKMSG